MPVYTVWFECSDVVVVPVVKWLELNVPFSSGNDFWVECSGATV